MNSTRTAVCACGRRCAKLYVKTRKGDMYPAQFSICATCARDMGQAVREHRKQDAESASPEERGGPS